MTRAELEAFVERRVDGFRRTDSLSLGRQYADDAIVESPMFATLHGRKAIENSYRTFFATFPDLDGTTDAVVIDAPRVALFTTFEATHAGEIFGLPPTHRRIHFKVSVLMTCQDGLCVHERRIYDFTGLLVQVGVLRAKPARP